MVKMQKINVIRFLLDEIENEVALLEKYKIEYAEADKKRNAESKKTGKYVGIYQYFDWKGREPRKTLIKNNMRMVRRLALHVIDEVK